ncbi:unknown [Ruminococcus sp. CAG:60]|nr:unknown [Ruminococcus sp. CAG:60]
MDQGGFAAACGTKDGEGAACWDGEVDVFQNRVIQGISEGHIAETDVSGQRWLVIGICRILFLCFQNISHTLHGNACLTHIGDDSAQASHRPGEGGVVGKKGNKFAKGDPSFHSEHHAQNHNRQYLQVGDQIARCPEHTHQLTQVNPEV